MLSRCLGDVLVLGVALPLAVLEANGLSHIEIWESERAFNADGWDGRCSNHTGGLFAALSIVSNAARLRVL